MNQPEVQFVQTEDGVNIAYWTLGEGEPLVAPPSTPFSASQSSLQVAEVRAWWERVAESRMLVRFDHRGSGLSQRTAMDSSLEARVLDLEAVVGHLGVDQVALLASTGGGPLGIAYAAKHPEQVSALLLFCAVATVQEGQLPSAMMNLADVDPKLAARAWTRELMGWDGERADDRIESYLEEVLSNDNVHAMYRQFITTDASDYVTEVGVRTLVMQRSGVSGGAAIASREVASLLASQIAGARLVMLDGDSAQPFMGDTEALHTIIKEFLDESRPNRPTNLSSSAADTHTILFTDMASSTSLTQQLGDAAAQEVRRTHNQIVRQALSANDGSEIKHTGDGIMADFAAASTAIECAIAIQRGVAAHREENPDSPLGVYIGLNAGEPIVEDDDLYGTSINLAARICDHAEPGQIVAADVVRQLAAGKDFLFSDLGEIELRGFEDPVKLWELSWQEQG